MSFNQRKIQLGSREYLVIDLTQPLTLDTEVFPGDPKPQREIFCEIGKTGYQHYIHKIGDHNFQPHADAPNHQNPELTGKGMEIFGLEYYFNKAILIDLSGADGAREIEGIKYLVNIEKKHLEPFADKIAMVGAILIRSGYDKWLEVNKSHTPENLPYLSQEAGEFLASFNNVKVVGIDSLTVDIPGSHASHWALKNKLIIESVVHLDQIPLDKRDNFDLQAFPIKIAGATGGPIAACAFVSL